jgi:salicylate hydroxylase
LSAALALSRGGFNVTLYERANALEEFGAGLQLTPNATRVLSRIGVLESVRQFAIMPAELLTLRGSDNVELMRLRLDNAGERWGAPYLVIHRADLQRVLVEAVRRRPNIDLTLGATVSGFTSDSDSVSTELTRGASSRLDASDLLIGADGLHSRVREHLGLGAADQADFTGRVAYRATVNVDDIDRRLHRNSIVLRLGPKAHLVQYPLRGGSTVNLVAVIESSWRAGRDDHPWNGRADASALDRAFANWSKETRALLKAPAEWRAWPLYSRSPIASFSFGRVALVGDAAHPMVPFLAQGAAQAIEDAGALAGVFSQTQNVSAALAAYSDQRVARATRVQRAALNQGRIYHMSGPLALARDTAMRVLGSQRIGARYDWLFRA